MAHPQREQVCGLAHPQLQQEEACVPVRPSSQDQEVCAPVLPAQVVALRMCLQLLKRRQLPEGEGPSAHQHR